MVVRSMGREPRVFRKVRRVAKGFAAEQFSSLRPAGGLKGHCDPALFYRL